MKVLRADPKNMVVPAAFAFGLLALFLGVAETHGTLDKMTVPVLIVLGVFVLMTAVTMGHRLEFYTDRIEVKMLFWNRVIDLTPVVVSQLSGNVRYPFALNFYDRLPDERTRPFAVITLKPYKREDLRWLLAQPEIKFVNAPRGQ